MKIETIQYKKSRIYKEIEEDQYAKSLAKKVRAVRYFMCEIFGKMFYPNSWRRHAGVSLKGTDVVAENQQKHLSLSFATKAWIYRLIILKWNKEV